MKERLSGTPGVETTPHAPGSGHGPIVAEAAKLLDDRRPTRDVVPPRLAPLVDFIRRNKVVVFRNRHGGSGERSCLRYPGLETAAEAFERDRIRCDRQRRRWMETRERLEACGIDSLLLKAVDDFPYTSSNLDVLVPAGRLDDAAARLAEIDYHEIHHYWEPNKRLLLCLAGSDCELKVHLHDRVSWIVLEFVDPESLWRGARGAADPVVRRPAPEHLVATLLAHTVYETGRVSFGDVLKIREAVADPGFDWGELLRVVRDNRWTTGLAFARLLYAAAERRAFESAVLDAPALMDALPPVARAERQTILDVVGRDRWPLELPDGVRRRFYLRKLWSENRSPWIRRCRDLAGLASQLLWPRLGLRRRPASLICVCGIDGSGKSTQVDALARALKQCDVPYRRIWMRGGFSGWSERVKSWLRRSSSRIPRHDDHVAKSAAYRGSLGRIWCWLVVGEQVLHGLFRVRLPKAAGWTLVADRYVVDTIVDLTERTGDERFPDSWKARLLRALAPRPDLTVLLDVPGSVAVARKTDHFSRATLDARRALYRRLIGSASGCLVLDATESLDSTTDRVVSAGLAVTLQRMRDRNRLNRQSRGAWVD